MLSPCLQSSLEKAAALVAAYFDALTAQPPGTCHPEELKDAIEMLARLTAIHKTLLELEAVAQSTVGSTPQPMPQPISMAPSNETSHAAIAPTPSSTIPAALPPLSAQSPAPNLPSSFPCTHSPAKPLPSLPCSPNPAPNSLHIKPVLRTVHAIHPIGALRAIRALPRYSFARFVALRAHYLTDLPSARRAFLNHLMKKVEAVTEFLDRTRDRLLGLVASAPGASAHPLAAALRNRPLCLVPTGPPLYLVPKYPTIPFNSS